MSQLVCNKLEATRLTLGDVPTRQDQFAGGYAVLRAHVRLALESVDRDQWYGECCLPLLIWLILGLALALYLVSAVDMRARTTPRMLARKLRGATIEMPNVAFCHTIAHNQPKHNVSRTY